jgi:hypothetical protein
VPLTSNTLRDHSSGLSPSKDYRVSETSQVTLCSIIHLSACRTSSAILSCCAYGSKASSKRAAAVMKLKKKTRALSYQTVGMSKCEHASEVHHSIATCFGRILMGTFAPSLFHSPDGCNSNRHSCRSHQISCIDQGYTAFAWCLPSLSCHS